MFAIFRLLGIAIILLFMVGCETINYEKALRRHSPHKVCNSIGFPLGPPASPNIDGYAFIGDSHLWERLYRIEDDNKILIADGKREGRSHRSSTYAVPPGTYRIENVEFRKRIRMPTSKVKGPVYTKQYYKEEVLERKFSALHIKAKAGRVTYIDEKALSDPKYFIQLDSPEDQVKFFSLFEGYLERGYCNEILEKNSISIQQSLD